MFIYQFVKYNASTNLVHINKYSNAGAVICFDLEDSVFDWVNPNNSKQLKSGARIVLDSILYAIKQYDIKSKFGIRINTEDAFELEKDIALLAGKKIHSIFIPKVTEPGQIINLYNRLKESNVFFEEILPIIETKKALTNLPVIIKKASEYFNKIVFGHCDYNLSIGSLQFFHQYNSEYWKWANKIIEVASANNITFVNSVFLNLGDNEFFSKMLSHLYNTLGNNFGQVTLTTRQSEVCNKFNKTFTGFKKLIDDRSELSIPETYASDIVRKFENNCKTSKSHANGKNNILISPQEYSLAKIFSSAENTTKQKLVFVGGCFPVQYNILFEDLFHQSLKQRYQSTNKSGLNIKLIRYERFLNCLDKIRGYCDINKVDKLIFHIRPEPVLRYGKLFYKYKDKDGRLNNAFNLPMFKIVYPERYDIYEIERSFPNYVSFGESKSKSRLKKDINYAAGTLFGNVLSAINKYIKLTYDILEYCNSNEIDLIVLGPPVRKLTKAEPFICKHLNDRISNYCTKNNIPFIDTFKETNENSAFFDNTGKFATQDYHDFIADKLFLKL